MENNDLLTVFQSANTDVVNVVSRERIELGVLSEVYCVEVSFKKTAKDPPPSKWILKVCRPDLDVSWMFRAEQAFYTNFGQKLVSDQLPFDITKAISATEKHIILEYVNDATCHDLLKEGCPSDKIQFLVHSMACWHAQCWDKSDLFIPFHNSQVLVSPPGIGQRLSPMQKEYLFATHWEDTLNHIDFQEDPSLRDFAVDFCKRLEHLRLRDVHGIVHNNRITCIHGDYHIANFLFPRNGSKPFLIDWTAYGYGNPMVDFAFFIIVSTNDQVVSNFDTWLESYHRSLTNHNPKLHSFSLSVLQDWFGWALLCQWMVLVSYDKLCRSIANGVIDRVKRDIQLKHFENVNRRALLCLRAFRNWDFLKNIPQSTEEERKEAQLHSDETPIMI